MVIIGIAGGSLVFASNDETAPFSIASLEDYPTIRIVRLRGAIDQKTVADLEHFRKWVEKHRSFKHKHVLLDFKSVTHIDTSAVAEIIQTVSELKTAHFRLGAINLNETVRNIGNNLADCDLFVSLGGVSVGDHDLIRPAMKQLAIELKFWRVAMKPGKPLVSGQSGTTRFLGLPGNPASSAVCFHLFGLPYLRTLQGENQVHAPRVHLPLLNETIREAGRLEFLRARLEPGGVRTLAQQASASMFSFSQANALVIAPAEQSILKLGSPVECILL